MSEKPNDVPTEGKMPDRPLECTECKKPIAVWYTEVVGHTMTHTCMCSDCPVLERKLRGTPHTELTPGEKEGAASLACGNCGTTLEAIRVGTPLGCDLCYEVFDDVLIPEMLTAKKIPPRIANGKKSVPVHIGRAPGEIKEISPSLRLLALNEALSEMLKKEDYEQAAWLRDQIKALTEKKPAKKEKSNEKSK